MIKEKFESVVNKFKSFIKRIRNSFRGVSLNKRGKIYAATGVVIGIFMLIRKIFRKVHKR